MTVMAIVIDAFLSALEQGANPPAVFTVRLPWAAVDNSVIEGSPLQIAGFTVYVIPEGQERQCLQ